MIVVTDTTPLRYLVEIGHIDVLPKIFGSIVTSPVVIQELCDPETPEKVRDWANRPLPAWLTLESPKQMASFSRVLDAGERDALSLAVEKQPSRVLIDEKDGWKEATRLGLRPLRTIPVLWFGADLGHLDLDEALGRLEKTSYRVTEATLSRYREREATLQRVLQNEFRSIREGKERDRGDEGIER